MHTTIITQLAYHVIMCHSMHYYIHFCMSRVYDYEEKVKSLSVELVQVTSRLQAAERKANEPSPLLLTLQQELSQMKVVN